MSAMFLCGKFGCVAIEQDDKAVAETNERFERWIRAHKRQTGQFPTPEEKEKYWEATYERLTNIKIAGERCPECGQLLPDEELK